MEPHLNIRTEEVTRPEVLPTPSRTQVEDLGFTRESTLDPLVPEKGQPRTGPVPTNSDGPC